MNPEFDVKLTTDNRQPTAETLWCVFILALAACLRLYRLGLAPLAADEAAQALAAWRGALPPPGASPALYAVNSLLFALMGASDSLARLGAAIFGTLLAGAPLLLRRRLGRLGARGAALALAISPTAIAASRTLSGEIVVALAGLGLVAAADQYAQTANRKWMYAMAALLGLGLMGGSGVYTLALIFAGGLGLGWLIREQAPDRRTRTANDFLPSTFHLPLDWPRLAATAAAVVVGASTVLLWRPFGLSAVGDLLPAWLRGFAPTAGSTAWYLPFQILIVYEMLALAAGMLGLTLASARGDMFGVLLGYGAISAAIIVALRPGRTPQEVLFIVTPLACLSGYTVESMAASFRRNRLNVIEAVFIAALLVTLAFGIISLADYAANPGLTQTVGLAAQFVTIHRALVPEVIALLMLSGLAALLLGLTGIESTARCVALSVLLVMTLGTFSAGWGAAQRHPGDPRELVSGPRPASPALRLMVNTLKIASEQQTGEPYALPLVVVTQATGRDDVVEWTLRDFYNARFVSALERSSAPYAVVAPYAAAPELASGYAGQDFAVFTYWSPEGRDAAGLLRWLLYRSSPDAPQPLERVVVWVRQEVIASNQP